MSRYGAKTYGRKAECRTSVQFDHLLSDKANKPSTAKVSVAGIHRWGMTSFTSLRKSRLNGQKEVAEAVEPPKRMKLDTTMNISEDPFTFESNIDSPNSADSPVSTMVEKKPPVAKPNKFFKSGSSRVSGSVSSPKNSDFDSLLQSVKPATNQKNVLSSNCNIDTKPQEAFSSIHPGFSDMSLSSNDQQSFLTSSSPNIVNLSYVPETPKTCASTNYAGKPSIHYLTPVQPYESNDSASKAFDALQTNELSMMADFSAKNQLSGAVTNIVDQFVKPDKIYSVSQQVPYRNADNNHMHHISYSLDYKTNVEKSCDSNDKYVNPLYLSIKAGLDSKAVKEQSSESFTESFISSQELGGSSQDYLNSSQELITSSQELSSSQELASCSQEFTCSSQELASCSQELTNSSQELASFSQEFANTSQDLAGSSQQSLFSQSSKSSDMSRPKKIFSSSLKFKAKYNHRHWHESRKDSEEDCEVKGPSLADEFEDEIIKDTFKDDLIEDVTDTSYGELRSVKCPKESKQFYTVVKNVKQAYQCHESGETQEFNDDIEYLLECVQDCNGIGTRCLSVLNLAAKCMGPAFRIHLRAHGTMPKIFSALKDASSDPNLALCTATLMFVLSQDRLTMDIEASTLSLMLQLLETDPELRNPEKEYDLILKDPALCAMQDKHREKVYQLCEEMQQKGHAKHLKLDNINTGILAMETLLSLTSRKAGEWFKEEIRTLHGLDHIADTVSSCVELLIPEEQEIAVHPTEIQLDRIRKIDRCLRVLENVTHMTLENQVYLMNYKNMSLISTFLRLMKLCKQHFLEQTPIEIIEEPTPKSTSESPVLSCLLNLLKILSNITYNNAINDSQFPSEEGFMHTLLICILQVPRAVPVEKRFDLLVLSLGLMINLVEYCDENSVKFMDMNAVGSFDTVNDGYEMPASETLVELMLSRLEAARVSEEQADELLDSQEQKQAISIQKKDVEAAVEDLEETLMKTLQKAGKHMEHSIIAAYIVILLGCVIQKNPDFIEIVRDYVPDGKFDVMVEVLKKFKSFITLTGSVRNRDVVFIQKVIQLLESS